MSKIVLLDAGPLSLLSHPKQTSQSAACVEWLKSLTEQGARVLVPEITDYEVRRELLRAKKYKGLAKLDALTGLLEYLPLTTPAMRQAARLWAEARQQGRPTAGDNTIDGDVILAAQAVMLGVEHVIATTNVGHLTRFTEAALWQNI